jgi:hypothetical protein
VGFYKTRYWESIVAYFGEYSFVTIGHEVQMKLSVSSTNSQINRTWHRVLLGFVISYQYFYGTVKILVTKKEVFLLLCLLIVLHGL